MPQVSWFGEDVLTVGGGQGVSGYVSGRRVIFMCNNSYDTWN